MIDAARAAALYSSRSREGAALVGVFAGGGKLPMNADKIEAASKDFEALFITQMLEPMFGDSLGAEAFGDEETADVYKSLMVEHYAKQIARSGGIGIASYVKRELLKQQEISHEHAATHPSAPAQRP